MSDQQGVGEGAERSFVAMWNWPPWITLLLLILLALFVLRTYRREPLAGRWRWLSLAAIRFAVLALVVFMLHGWSEHRHRTELPELIVAVDVSESMALVDSYRDPSVGQAVQRFFADDPSRLGQAKSLLTTDRRGWLKSLARHYRVKLVAMGDDVREVDLPEVDNAIDPTCLQATDEHSRLGEAVRSIIDQQRGRSTAAIILLTDGITTDGQTLGDVATYAHSRSLPLHIVGLGSEQPPRDVRLSDLLVDEVAFVGDILNFDLQLHSVGFAGKPATVRLFRGQEQLAEVLVELPEDDQPLAVRLPHRPDADGDFEYVLEVDPFEGEANTGNNRLVRTIRIRNSTIRVLLVQSSPSFEFRYLKSLLSRATKHGTTDEKAIELTTVLQESDVDYIADDGSAGGTFPVQKDELFKQDVLIFGDANPEFFSHSLLDHIREFVEVRGGGVVFIAGPNYFPMQYSDTPLVKLLPFDLATATLPTDDQLNERSFRVKPTELGIDSPTLQLGDSLAASLSLWNELPELRWLLEIPDTNPTAMILAEASQRTSLAGRSLPVIAMQFVGAGKVVFHATDETYLWARHQGDDRLYGRYWHQTIRYLSRSKLLTDRDPVELTSDSQQYLQGDTIRLRVRFRDERLAPVDSSGVAVSLLDGRDERHAVTLTRVATDRGLFEATLPELSIGDYEAQLVSPLVSQAPSPYHFSVDSLRHEGSRLAMNASDLKAAAATSRGRFYTIRNASRLLKSLPRGDQVRIESSPPEPIWNSPWIAAMLVGLLTAEWLLRKRVGLV